ncbi:hypothetical protein STA3757_13570 [Stanieria sp. NIES-3757]|nr:hypothetical protein STA3757_13570 [Stanieria sp. NIES-3757]
MSWKAIARSAMGTSHQKQEMPCQDYGSYKILDDVIIGAVADGAGSAKYADIGAKLAVKTALEAFTDEDISKITESLHSESSESRNQSSWSWKSLTSFKTKDRNGFSSVAIHQPQSHSEQEVRQIFTKTVQKVRVALEKRAANNNYSFDDLACTLLVFIATPDWVTAMQIGDGFIVLRCQEEDTQLLFPPDKGEYINETTFVTSDNALEAMRVCVKKGKPEFICASTDGLERLAIRMSDWTPFIPFFQPLEQYLRETSNPEEEDEYLKSFLNSDRLNARTDDDKTLLLCFYDSSTNSCE